VIRVREVEALLRVLRRVAGPAALAVLIGLAGPAPAVEFPGPVPIELNGAVRTAVPVPVEGDGDLLVVGLSSGDLAVLRYSPGAGILTFVDRIALGAEIVAIASAGPAAGGGLELVVATRSPDRLFTVAAGTAEPFLTLVGTSLLEEEPGRMVVAADGRIFMVLPGLDTVLRLERDGNAWAAAASFAAGDRPVDLAAADLDGDGADEILVAAEGPLSRAVMLYRRAGDDLELQGQVVLEAGPSALAVVDGGLPGVEAVAVVSRDAARSWTVAEVGGQLAVVGQQPLTVPAAAVISTVLGDGGAGLLTASPDRGLVESLRRGDGTWEPVGGYFPGCRPWGIVGGDINGDGVGDVVGLGGDSRLLTVMFGSDEGTFWGFPALALPGQPGSLNLADFDGDGVRDLAVMVADAGTLAVFPGLPGGGIGAVPLVQSLFPLPGAVTAMDAETGGPAELVAFDPLAGLMQVMRLEGETFVAIDELAPGAAVRRLLAGDLDADGHEDLVALLRTAPEISVYYGRGDGTFGDPVTFGFGLLAEQLVLVDLDADGFLDLVAADGINRIETALNVGGRAFVAGDMLNVGIGSRRLVTGDLDGDEDEDVVVVTPADRTLSFLENTGNGTLVRSTGSIALEDRPESAVVADLDADGRNDVAVNLRSAGTIGVLFKLADGSWSPLASFAASGDVAQFAASDINADGAVDFLTLDGLLQLGLTMLNIDRGDVPVAAPVLQPACDGGAGAVVLRPGDAVRWRLEANTGSRWQVVALDGIALRGELERADGSWRWRPDALLAGAGRLELRLVLEGPGGLVVHEAVLEACRDAGLPAALAWARSPWPIPFNPTVRAAFATARAGRVQASVHDLRGRRVALLLDEDLPAGRHELTWDGRDGHRPAAAGVYLLRITGQGTALTARLVLVK
jgi:hypothetical protein